jgi:hypothetical protein
MVHPARSTWFVGFCLLAVMLLLNVACDGFPFPYRCQTQAQFVYTVAYMRRGPDGKERVLEGEEHWKQYEKQFGPRNKGPWVLDSRAILSDGLTALAVALCGMVAARFARRLRRWMVVRPDDPPPGCPALAVGNVTDTEASLAPAGRDRHEQQTAVTTRRSPGRNRATDRPAYGESDPRIPVRCPHCRKVWPVKEQLAGHRVPCPACQAVLAIPCRPEACEHICARSSPVERVRAAATQPGVPAPDLVSWKVAGACLGLLFGAVALAILVLLRAPESPAGFRELTPRVTAPAPRPGR